MIHELPKFRRMIKAIGEHTRPKETAYRYELVEFKANGQFIVRHDVLITDTQMRADDDRLYEVWESDGWVLVTREEFQLCKEEWDKLRRGLGYGPVDEMGAMS